MLQLLHQLLNMPAKFAQDVAVTVSMLVCAQKLLFNIHPSFAVWYSLLKLPLNTNYFSITFAVKRTLKPITTVCSIPGLDVFADVEAIDVMDAVGLCVVFGRAEDDTVAAKSL